MSYKSPLLGIILVFSIALAGQGLTQDETPSGVAEVPFQVPQAGPGEGLESAVDADLYTLGPGDVLQIGVWGPEPRVWQVPITLEGTALIPTVGTIRVVGLSLETAKQTITERILDAYRGIQVSITLIRLRRFQIHVLGQVSRPGTYLATAVNRVSQAVNWAGGFSEGASRRRVLVKNQGTVRQEADLRLFLSRGRIDFNPLLMDGDVVFVPFRGKTFSIRGAVHAPGPYQKLEGDRFSNALELAGGLSTSASEDTIEVVRYPEGNHQPKRFMVTSQGEIIPAGGVDPRLTPEILNTFSPPRHLLESPKPVRYPDFQLNVDDIIFVRSVPEERRRQLVQISGEVTFPGTYAIEKEHTTLSHLVAMAGGLTEDAFLPEAKLIRSRAIRLDDREFQRLQKMPAADMSEDEYAYFKTRSRENPGLMVIDFEALLERGDRSQDILLRRDDRVEIPSRKNFVSVIGMVQYPGNILYESGLTANDYIRLAGGLAEDADKGKSRVIRATGSEWVPLHDAKDLHAGDTVWIPEKGEGKFWEHVRDVVSVTTQILAIYIVVDNAAK